MSNSVLQHETGPGSPLALRELIEAARISLLGEVMAFMAHEVSQPLSAMAVGADAAARWLDRDPPDLDQARGRLARIAGECRRATDIIARARAASQPPPARLKPVLLASLLQQCLAAIADSTLTSHNAAPDVEVLVDPPAIRLLLLDLLFNAIDAGAGTISTLIEPDGPHAIALRIADAGPGLAPGAIHDAFDLFHAPREGRAGLGLPVCRAIARANGGSLELADAPGGGTVVTLRLPVCPHARDTVQPR